MKSSKHTKHNFFLRIILPTLLVFILFTISFFALIIPSYESNLMKGKEEMIRELTNSAWSILSQYNKKYESGVISLEEAQKTSVSEIRALRYGESGKDYFWITDEYPNMIMHPYRPELNGSDLSFYSDPEGKKLFVEFVNVVKANGEGYVDYMWQWKDDSSKIVPKLSYVKEFKPWKWIIGTGIYIEDVSDQISNLTSNLVYITLSILLLVGILLSYIGKQSLKIEHERQLAEDGLRDSESKYRALVEASTDGLIMILENEVVYANNSLVSMLHYSGPNFISFINNLISDTDERSASGNQYLNKLINNDEFKSQVEAKLTTNSGVEKDVILYSSEITFGDKHGYTVIVKDISLNKKLEAEIGDDRARFNSLINNVNIGVFRAKYGKNGKFVEANASLLKMLGYDNYDDITELKLRDVISNTVEQNQFFEKLELRGILKNSVLQIARKDGLNSIVSVSALLIKDENGNYEFCDGIVEDISDRIKLDEERENLIIELQTSLKFLHQPLENFVRKAITCNINDSIKHAAKIITKNKYSAVLVQTDNSEIIGIVTDHDLRERAIAEYTNVEEAIHKVMSAPLITISENAFVFEALMKMHENSIAHLAVKNNEGNIVGIISSEELFKVERQSSAYLLREIDIAQSIEGLSEIKTKLPWLVKTLVDSGAKTKNITHIVTTTFDAITHKLIEFGIDRFGDPPVKFSFVALGSAGRKEQTLISDQDNAIIYEDINDELSITTKKYFDKLAEFICDGLNECGYDYCIGEAMAKNTKWTQPISVWKDYFHSWISNSSQQDLIDISIYFDFRHVFGDNNLTDELRTHLVKVTDNQAGFFQHLAKNCLLHKPPVGILGKLVLESKGDHPETFDIKSATMPISDFARIYALKYNLSDTNTLERLQSLSTRGLINKNSYDEIVLSYNFLMQLRFKHQAIQITERKPVDNFINPNELTQIETKTLKNTFSQILGIQKKLSYDFSGEAI